MGWVDIDGKVIRVGLVLNYSLCWNHKRGCGDVVWGGVGWDWELGSPGTIVEVFCDEVAFQEFSKS